MSDLLRSLRIFYTRDRLLGIRGEQLDSVSDLVAAEQASLDCSILDPGQPPLVVARRQVLERIEPLQFVTESIKRFWRHSGTRKRHPKNPALPWLMEDRLVGLIFDTAKAVHSTDVMYPVQSAASLILAISFVQDCRNQPDLAKPTIKKTRWARIAVKPRRIQVMHIEQTDSPSLPRFTGLSLFGFQFVFLWFSCSMGNR